MACVSGSVSGEGVTLWKAGQRSVSSRHILSIENTCYLLKTHYVCREHSIIRARVYLELDAACKGNFDDELLVGVAFQPFCYVVSLIVWLDRMKRRVSCRGKERAREREGFWEGEEERNYTSRIDPGSVTRFGSRG